MTLDDGRPPAELDADRMELRTAEGKEVPVKVRGMLARLAPGWRGIALVSRGPAEIAHNVDGHRVRQWVTVTACSLRLRHAGGLAGAGVWHDGRFVDAWTWVVCADPACEHTHADHPAYPPRSVPLALLAAMVCVPKPAAPAMDESVAA